MGNPEPLWIQLLGGFCVSIGGQVIDTAGWQQRKAAAIVKLLALEPSHQLHREQVMDALWPEFPPDAAANNLRHNLHVARRVLDRGTADVSESRLQRSGEMLLLGPPGLVSTDVERFEARVAAAWQSNNPASYYEAAALYTGDLLPDDRYEDWVRDRRTALRNSQLTLLLQLAGLHEQRGEVEHAADVLQRLLEMEPAHEQAHATLMRLYAANGQPHRAIVQYDQLTSALKRELDSRPEPVTQQLYQAIRDGRFPGATQPGKPSAGKRVAPDPRPVQIRLPDQPGPLFGREREISEVGQLLTMTRLVTLTGPGGIGKTRLAVGAAHELASRFPDGVFFVDLAPISDPELVVPTIAQTFGIRETGERLLDDLAAHIQSKSLLLILDNFERVVEAASDVSELLARCPELRIIITSRARFRVQGGQEYPVSSLLVPATGQSPQAIESLSQYAAVALFIQRVREIDPDFRLTDDTAPAIAEICRLLDGQPLAIELAAARSKVLSPQMLLARLDHPLELLTEGAHDAPPRQHTLRKTIAWSYELLNSAEQALFRCLAGFAGGCTLEAAGAVCTGEIDVLDGLTSLVDNSLVRPVEQADGSRRFQMLETIHEYGRERLESSGESAAVRERHAAFFLALAEEIRPELDGSQQATWFDRLEAEHDNFRAALTWLQQRGDAERGLRLVGHLLPFWFANGHLREGLTRAEAFLELPDASPRNVARAGALTTAGVLATWLGDPGKGTHLLEESLGIQRETGNRAAVPFTLIHLGIAASFQGNTGQAREFWEQSSSLSRELGDTTSLARSLNNLGVLASDRGDEDEAQSLIEESLSLAREIDHKQVTSLALGSLGDLATRQGNYARATRLLQEGLALRHEIRMRKGVVENLESLARLASLQEYQERAARLYAAASRLRELTSYPVLPAEREGYEHRLESLRATLGDELFTATWTAGRSMSLEEAIDYALGNTHPD